MPTNVYQALVQKIEPSADGTLHADVFVQLRTGVTPDFVYVNITNGHFTIVLTADEVLAVTKSTMTQVEKRKAIRDIIRARALERGIDNVDTAYADLINLFTFPDSINIRQ